MEKDVLGDRNADFWINGRMITGLFGTVYVPATCCCHGGDELSGYWLLKELVLLTGRLEYAVASLLGCLMTMLR
jgi:hypothetical protein